MFTFSQVVGVVAFLLFIYSVQRREKSEVLFVQVFAFTLYTIQYISVNAIVGTIIYLLNALRCLLFYFLEKRRKDTKLYFVIFLVISISCSVMTYDDICDIFPMIATVNSIFFMCQRDPKVIRIGQIFSCMMWIVYNIFNHVYVGVLTESLIIISCLITLIRYDLNFDKLKIELYIKWIARCDSTVVNFSNDLPIKKRRRRLDRKNIWLTEKENYGKIKKW